MQNLEPSEEGPWGPRPGGALRRPWSREGGEHLPQEEHPGEAWEWGAGSAARGPGSGQQPPRPRKRSPRRGPPQDPAAGPGRRGREPRARGAAGAEHGLSTCRAAHAQAARLLLSLPCSPSSLPVRSHAATPGNVLPGQRQQQSLSLHHVLPGPRRVFPATPCARRGQAVPGDSEEPTLRLCPSCMVDGSGQADRLLCGHDHGGRSSSGKGDFTGCG